MSRRQYAGGTGRAECGGHIQASAGEKRCLYADDPPVPACHGLPAPEDFEGIYSFDTPGTINALGIATSDIAEMGLREISRTVMQARREQNFAKDAQIGYDVGKGQNSGETERSVEHGSDIQDAGGLSPA